MEASHFLTFPKSLLSEHILRCFPSQKWHLFFPHFFKWPFSVAKAPYTVDLKDMPNAPDGHALFGRPSHKMEPFLDRN